MVLFKLNFRGRVVVIGFCTVNESIAGLLSFSYWDFRTHSEVRGQRYKFFKENLETVI